MTPFKWDPDKNELLDSERGVNFEMVEDEIAAGRFRVEENKSKNHPGQRVYLVGFKDPMPPGKTIIYVVPFEERENHIELITIFYSEYWQERFGDKL